MEPEKKSNGALVGLVIIIIILLIGGIYIWQVKSREAAQQNIETLSTEENEELKSLEADLDSIDTEVDVSADTIE